jgi:segregation and condensation protein B
MNERFQQLRLLEAILFAAAEPLGRPQLARHLPEGADFDGLMEELTGLYANRGVHLLKAGERWAFRTAADLSGLMQVENTVVRRLSRAAMETLAIIAYHQPVTRGEIEEIRGVGLSKGTLDTLLEIGWIKPKGRRRTPGRPVTWGTSDDFLDHFGLEGIDALPNAGELKAAGLLDSRPAVTALGASGLLSEADSETAEAEEEDPVEEEPWDILAAEFGENLRETDLEAEPVIEAEPETESEPENTALPEPGNAAGIQRARSAPADGIQPVPADKEHG